MDKEDPIDESDLDPVDNSSLVDSNGELSVSTASGIDVEYLPRDAWDLLVAWYVNTFDQKAFCCHPSNLCFSLSIRRYGEPEHTLLRQVIPRGISKEPAIELFPPCFRVYRLVDDSFAFVSLDSPDLYVKSSEAQLVKDLLPIAALTADPSTSAGYRVWKVQLPKPEGGSEFPKRKFVELGAELVEPSDKTLSDSLIDSEHSFVVEFNKYGSWIVDVPPAKALHGNGADASSSSTHFAPPPLFGQGDFFGRMEQSRPPSLNSNGVPSSSALLKPATFTPNIRKKPAQTPGTLGLGNM
jgi:ubiquitin carboxyl-terminal hydrolase 4/11